jgi:Asp-tRNA(Asn)/Glu-tRNA(Gln) amidotransferase A subunit family amidase
MVDRCLASAVELSELIRTGSLSPTAVVDAHLDRIDDCDDELGAYVTVLETRAREAARKCKRELEAGEDPGPLAGVPVGVKDIVDVAGVPTTHGTSFLADNIADSDDVGVSRLREAGAVILGKTNTPPFARSAVTVSDVGGTASTPFDTSMNAGGSSGGSAAAVAAGLTPLAYGTDGGGSIRIPAALCGVYGFKPTFGRIPWVDRPDAFAHARGNHAGPLTRTVEDAGLALDVLAGPDHRDPFSVPDDDVDFRAAANRKPEGLRIAYSPDLGVFPVADAVEAVVGDAVEDLADATAGTVERVDVDFGMELSELVEPKYHCWGAVHTAVLAERVEREHGIDPTDHPDAMGDEFAETVREGQAVDAVSYKSVNVPHTRIYDAIRRVFEDYDVICTPTVSVSGVENGTTGPDSIDGEPVDSATDWFLTFPFNFGGPPAASIPAGQTSEGLPVGLQIAAPRFADDLVLSASAALESIRPWADVYRTL